MSISYRSAGFSLVAALSCALGAGAWSFPVPEHGELRFTEPKGWHSELGSQSDGPTFVFQSDHDRTTVFISFVTWDRSSRELARVVQEGCRELLPEAVEKKITYQDLRTSSGFGLWCWITLPQASDFRFATYGVAPVGEFAIGFAIATDAAPPDGIREALSLLDSAEQFPAPAANAGDSNPLRPAIELGGARVVIDRPGFYVTIPPKIDDRSEALVAVDEATQLVVRLLADLQDETQTSAKCREKYFPTLADQGAGLVKTEISKRGPLELAEWGVGGGPDGVQTQRTQFVAAFLGQGKLCVTLLIEKNKYTESDRQLIDDVFDALAIREPRRTSAA